MSISLDEFFTSLHHGQRSNERFGYWQYFMHAIGDEVVADFLQDTLQAVSDAIDNGSLSHVVELVERWDQRYADWFVENMPYTPQVINTTIPWTPLARPLSASRVALITSGGFYKAEDPAYGPGETTTEQAMQWQAFMERHPTYRVIPKRYPRGSSASAIPHTITAPRNGI